VEFGVCGQAFSSATREEAVVVEAELKEKQQKGQNTKKDNICC
jgi:hypothetical protein